MNQNDQMREALRKEFPLLDEIGLDQELHHCEWSIQQERKRLHQLLNELQAEQALFHVNETPKNEHDSGDVLNKSEDKMTRQDYLDQISRLRSSLLMMDRVFRSGRHKSTSPVEIAQALKALRMLTLSIEAGGLDDCFALDIPIESEVI